MRAGGKTMLFQDRTDAGRQLATALQDYRDRPDVKVLALPRGGVPVGFEVARSLGAPLDVWVVGKVGTPNQTELGLGAVSEGGTVLANRNVLWSTGIDGQEFERLAREELEDVERRVTRYRSARPAAPLAGKTVLLVDDGITTGASLRVALRAIRAQGPARAVVAVPVSSMDALDALRKDADAVICLRPQPDLWSVGAWYRNFKRVTDEQVCLLLEVARRSNEEPLSSDLTPQPTPVPAPRAEDISVEVNGAPLSATLSVPRDPTGLVLFAHGPGGGRHSPRNRFVARALEEAGFATLLIDLLTGLEETREAATGGADLRLLAGRLLGVATWAHSQPGLEELPLAYFGAGAGAPAALIAAAIRPERVEAIVCRGGEPDLAGSYSERVTAPTLFLVGERDHTTVGSHRAAYGRIWAPKQLTIVGGATRHFEEPNAMELVAQVTLRWLEQHLGVERATGREASLPS